MSDKQLSRVAGCPRLPLPVFKAAAEQYFVGKDATRTEQQNGKKSKVKLLRELSTNDPAVRSWLIKFAKEYKADQTRKAAASQGLTINADGRAVADIDRMVALLEGGQKLSDHFTADELNGAGDPAWDAAVKEIEARGNRSVIHGCDWCGFNNGPAVRQVTVNGRTSHYCPKHDGTSANPFRPGDAPQGFVSASNPTVPASPSPAVADPTGRLAYLQAIREVHEAEAAARARRGPYRATYGPTDPEAWKISAL
jgi:hypothetical protein